MYEEQKPFTLLEFCNVSSFLNHFMFKAIWNGLAGRHYFDCGCIFMTSDCLYVLYFLCIFFLRATDASSFHSYGSSASNYNLFHAAHTLLMVVYRRDCRRPFAPKDHWLVKDVKSSLLVAELERGRQSVQVERSDVCVFPVRTSNSSPFCFAILSLFSCCFKRCLTLFHWKIGFCYFASISLMRKMPWG